MKMGLAKEEKTNASMKITEIKVELIFYNTHEYIKMCQETIHEPWTPK